MRTGAVEVCVLDSSVGVKWLRQESGSQDAWALLARHMAGEAILAVDSLFFYEVVRAACRGLTAENSVRTWQDLKVLGLAEIRTELRTVQAAAAAQEKLGCSLYDAFPAGLADLLDAPLYSADARAHGAHPRVRLIG